MFCIKCGGQLNTASVCPNCREENNSLCGNNYLKSPEIIEILKKDSDFETVMSKNNGCLEDTLEAEEKSDKEDAMPQKRHLETDEDNKAVFEGKTSSANISQSDITYNDSKSVKSPCENISPASSDIDSNMHRSNSSKVVIAVLCLAIIWLSATLFSGIHNNQNASVSEKVISSSSADGIVEATEAQIETELPKENITEALQEESNNTYENTEETNDQSLTKYDIAEKLYDEIDRASEKISKFAEYEWQEPIMIFSEEFNYGIGDENSANGTLIYVSSDKNPDIIRYFYYDYTSGKQYVIGSEDSEDLNVIYLERIGDDYIMAGCFNGKVMLYYVKDRNIYPINESDNSKTEFTENVQPTYNT